MNFEFFGNFDIFKCEIVLKIKIQSPAFQIVKMAFFELLKSLKIDFT